jgi:shikimate kinase
MAPKLILTGFMATGKSTVARALARRLGWRLLDCDAEIVARARRPIHEIFRDSGEAHFRAIERSLVAEIASDRRRCVQCGKPRPLVVATGGGALVDVENYAALQRCGLIVCLVARPEVIASRIASGTKTRPMLIQGAVPLMQQITELMEARREVYARASIVVDTSERSIDQVVDAILEEIAESYRERWTASP